MHILKKIQKWRLKKIYNKFYVECKSVGCLNKQKFVNCLINTILYGTSYLKMYSIAHFSKFKWEGFIFLMYKNSYNLFRIFLFCSLLNIMIILIIQSLNYN